MRNTVKLQYGEKGLRLDLEGINATILEPHFAEGLKDEADAFAEAVRTPIHSIPLREKVGEKDTVAVVISDITRPLPSDRLLPWLFRELSHVPKEQFTIIVGTGSHRLNTRSELAGMVGEDIVGNYRIINHCGHDPETLVHVGDSPFGYPVYYNREYVEADRRIITGFIEPHFMAGFSGGLKAVFPGITGVEAIMQYHGVKNIGDPKSTWGILENNPTQDSIRAAGAFLPVDFCINVTLNRKREITRFFCGETLAAHGEGCRFAKETAMIACEEPFPIVITTNSGYPLDQNLYQSVKGMSAAAQILKPGGLILIASRCHDGFPEHGNFKRQLFEHASPEAILETLHTPGFSEFDQWETQMLAQILLKGRVGLHSELPPQEVEKAFLFPVPDLRATLDRELAEIGPDAPVAVLPEGPQTIPYLLGQTPGTQS